MTAQKVPEKGSAESFLVSPGYLAAAQVVDLDNAETPHQEPPESSFKTPQNSRERHSQDCESRALKRQEEDNPEEDDLADPAPQTDKADMGMDTHPSSLCAVIATSSPAAAPT
ncbi:hypothetical protein FIBSPDRAFT_948418 [Athelia psychrophila]|uniref:Uncharacterized protein n=1 Tax=Athelia psychrophila TaxID=1759441 RepID=A0A166QSC0_9AGAM|nr:hypothetical protein FIBSPDRAFT_948418 [Fibularhizoctonia sp. CBS 109695]